MLNQTNRWILRYASNEGYWSKPNRERVSQSKINTEKNSKSHALLIKVFMLLWTAKRGVNIYPSWCKNKPRWANPPTIVNQVAPILHQKSNSSAINSKLQILKIARFPPSANFKWSRWQLILLPETVPRLPPALNSCTAITKFNIWSTRWKCRCRFLQNEWKRRILNVQGDSDQFHSRERRLVLLCRLVHF